MIIAWKQRFASLEAEVACPRPGGPLQGGQRPDLRGPMHRVPCSTEAITRHDPVQGTGGGISIGHRRSGCPSRGGVLREYRRKTLKNGPLNGGPARERGRGRKEDEKKQEEDGGRRMGRGGEVTRILTTVASMQTSRRHE